LASCRASAAENFANVGVSAAGATVNVTLAPWTREHVRYPGHAMTGEKASFRVPLMLLPK
jgi:hypothetical protein